MLRTILICIMALVSTAHNASAAQRGHHTMRAQPSYLAELPGQFAFATTPVMPMYAPRPRRHAPQPTRVSHTPPPVNITTITESFNRSVVPLPEDTEIQAMIALKKNPGTATINRSIACYIPRLHKAEEEYAAAITFDEAAFRHDIEVNLQQAEEVDAAMIHREVDERVADMRRFLAMSTNAQREKEFARKYAQKLALLYSMRGMRGDTEKSEEYQRVAAKYTQ